MTKLWSCVAPAAGLLLALQAQTGRQIPGITSRDAYPNGCVDCHVAGTTADTRLSTLLARWTTAVPPPLLEKAKAASAAPAKIVGKHPTVPIAKANIPQSCMAVCHKKGSTIAPPFAQLLHTIHLVGASNQFLTANQGECTHCHKLDPKTGAWKLPGGTER